MLEDQRAQVSSDIQSEWEERLATTQQPAHRVRYIVGKILSRAGLAKRQQVETETDSLLKLTVGLTPYAKLFKLDNAIDEAKADDIHARKYLATMAICQWTVCRYAQFKADKIGKAEFKAGGDTVIKAVKDLDMWESTKASPHAVDASYKRELDSFMAELA